MKTTVKVYNDFKYPLEPAKLTTMGEYNQSLCLFKTMFELNEQSLPISKVFKTWKYNEENKSYSLEIDNIHWSDGNELLAKDIKLSITRLKTVAPESYRSIISLLRNSSEKSIQIKSNKHIDLHVEKPDIEIFKRLTGVFIPIIREDQLDRKSLEVINHSVSLAGFIFKDYDKKNETLILEANTRYFGYSPNMPQTVKMRKHLKKINQFKGEFKNDQWENLILDLSFLKSNDGTSLSHDSLSYWSRPIDRVLHIFPSKKVIKDSALYTIIQILGKKISNTPVINWNNYASAEHARSLQPPGFILNQDIKYSTTEKKFPDRTFKIAASNNIIPLEELKQGFENIGLKVDFTVLKMSSFVKAIDSDDYDFILMGFGAADPSPTTWLNLVLDNKVKFIGDYDNIYRDKFREIVESKEDTNKKNHLFRSLIAEAGREGRYVPIAHFSSVAIAEKEIDFALIRETDETVDLSKLRIKKNK